MVETVAAQIVSLIAPSLIKAGKGALDNAVSMVLEAINKKIKGDEYAEQTLKRLKEKPKDKDRASAMSMILAEKMRSDKKFAALLEQYARQVQPQPGDEISQNITIDRSSKVGGNVTQIGKQNIDRKK